MAMTHDYLDYLNEQVGISPANSQEELQAAQVISDLMAQHDVEPRVEEFDAPMLPVLAPTILSILMFVGMFVCGLGVLPLTIVGFLLAALPAALAVMRVFGREVRLTFGPRAQSQNVIAVHRAEGPLVAKGNRKIVVVAHYDSPRENFLLTSPVAPYLSLIKKATVPCSLATGVCALAQLLVFLPDVARIVLWIVGMLAAVPGVVIAAGAIAERVGACTEGANDNKAAVAALLGVLENVRPSGMVPKPRPVAPPTEPAEDDQGDESVENDENDENDDELAAQTGDLSDLGAGETGVVAAAQPMDQGSEPAVQEAGPIGRRHGEEVLRALGILPETCEIVYVSSPAPKAPAAGATAELAVQAPASRKAAAAQDDSVEQGDSAEKTRDDLLSTGRFSIVMDDGSRGVGPKDSTGMIVMGDEYDADATQPAAVERPDAPSDPEWGKTSFRPQLSSMARRASLFDLPDPSSREVDPFDTDPGATRVQPAQTQRRGEAVPAPSAQAEPLPTITPEDVEAARPKRGLGSLLSRLRGLGKAQEEPEGEALEDDGSERGPWRGGAASRSGLRLVEGEEDVAEEQQAPSEEELRDAVLSLGDDELIAHDIWFVALGGSALDHAGMRDFVARHRSEVRGCFVVNLDCVGAGALTALKNEGLEGTRRSDRRVTRLLMNSAADLHLDLGSVTYDWTDTDATPAMRSSLRAVTLMGLDENGFPALSGTPDDLPENVSGDQAADVAALVTEMIRRS